MINQLLFAIALIITLGVFAFTAWRYIRLFKLTQPAFPVRDFGKRFGLMMRERLIKLAAMLAEKLAPEHIESWQRSGLSQAEYCRLNSLRLKNFWYWKKRNAGDRKSVV